MAGEWYLGSTPLNQLSRTIGYSPNGQLLPSVAQGIQQQSNQATAQALEAYFAEERRRWDADYGQKQSQIDNQYSIAKAQLKTQQQAQALDDWYKRESAALARERLTQDKYEFETSTAIKRGELGLDVLKTASSLRGPENYYQAAEYARGVSQMPQTATFLQSLRDQTKMADYGAQGGLPNPETMDTLTAKMTGTNTGGNAVQDGNNLATIGNIAAKGAHQLAPGSLEGLTDNERALFTSGLDRLGVDTPTFLNQYARSRVGQGISGTRAA